MDTARATVVVVHGVPAIQDQIARALASADCAPIRCGSFGDAAELEARDAPDVIVTDELVIRSDPNGFRAVRSRFPAVRVVALVAPLPWRHSDLEGVDCTIEKPADDGHVVRAIDWALKVGSRPRARGWPTATP